MKKLATVGLVAALVWSASGCLNDRRHEADLVDGQIKAMAGVANTKLDYDSSFENGQNLRLTVNLDPGITQPQASAVGRTFAEAIKQHHLSGHRVELNVRLPAVRQQQSTFLAEFSQAEFKLGENASPPVDLSAAEVGDSIAVWLHATRSQVAESASLTQPTRGGSAQSRDILIMLKPDATAADAQALQHSDPGLAKATWQITIVADPKNRPHDYESTPDPPSDRDKELWSQISTIVGPQYDATGSTKIPIERDPAETYIEISLLTGPDSEPRGHQIAMSVADLLPQFGHPVALSLRTYGGDVQLIVGGCWRHEPNHRRLALEVEMSRRYEKC